MKTLELKQMEMLNGGNCATGAASILVSSGSLIAIGLATGPIGWLGLSLALAGFALANYEFYSNPDCM